MNKSYILNEIKRTATANGGVPLGRLGFFKETGIREADWRGRFWARWNDAVREAGLEPNQKTEARSDDSMIEQFIALMRELGRFPVVSEMRLKKLRDGSFPNERTFERFGSRPQFVEKILDYCSGRKGYEDIAPLCDGVAIGHASESDDDESEEAFGFVYLLKSGRHYKIGHTAIPLAVASTS